MHWRTRKTKIYFKFGSLKQKSIDVDETYLAYMLSHVSCIANSIIRDIKMTLYVIVSIYERSSLLTIEWTFTIQWNKNHHENFCAILVFPLTNIGFCISIKSYSWK